MDRTNLGESSTRRLKDTVASPSTIANEVRQDSACGGDEDGNKDGSSLSHSPLRRNWNLENDIVVEVVSLEDEISCSGMQCITSP